MKNNGHVWRPIKTFRSPDRHEVDLWMYISPSPMSFGMGDSFRVVDAYRIDGKWFHRQGYKEMELDAHYITHWMPRPAPPHRP